MGARTALTPADLLTLPRSPAGEHYELSEGELITVGNAGARHERLKQQIAKLLTAYSIEHPVGEVFCGTQFTLSESTARIPDVAFVLNAKLERFPDDDSAIPFAPDVAIEIISDSEAAADSEEKTQQYLAAGVAEVWQIYPRLRLVRVRQFSSTLDLRGDQVIESATLPDFRAAVNAILGGPYPPIRRTSTRR